MHTIYLKFRFFKYCTEVMSHPQRTTSNISIIIIFYQSSKQQLHNNNKNNFIYIAPLKRQSTEQFDRQAHAGYSTESQELRPNKIKIKEHGIGNSLMSKAQSPFYLSLNFIIARRDSPEDWGTRLAHKRSTCLLCNLEPEPDLL